MALREQHAKNAERPEEDAAWELIAHADTYGRALQRCWREIERADWLISIAMHVGGDFADAVWRAWKTLDDEPIARIDPKEDVRVRGQVFMAALCGLPGATMPGDHGWPSRRRREALERLGPRLRALCPLPPALPLDVPELRTTTARFELVRTEELWTELEAMPRAEVIDLEEYRRTAQPRQAVRRARMFGTFRIAGGAR